MEKLPIMDAKNYDDNMEEIKRIAIRSIVMKDGKLLLVTDSFGEADFPGGGQDEGETDIETLIRETKEETGYDIIPDTIREFCELEEKRLSTKEPMIWHQYNRYYFCDVYPEQGECQFTPHEIRFKVCPRWLTLDEAIAANEALQEKEGVTPFNSRALNVMRRLKEIL